MTIAIQNSIHGAPRAGHAQDPTRRRGWPSHILSNPMLTQNDDGAADPSLFTQTRWTLVIQARDGSEVQAKVALNDLCQRYWYPLYVYLRGQGRTPLDAEDMTQAFFKHLHEGEVFQQASPEKGKLRAFLLVSLKNFCLNWQRKESAAKRGGGVPSLSIDREWAENRFQFEPVESVTPEELYDRRWAMTMLEKVLQDLEKHYHNQLGKGELFDAIKPTIAGGSKPQPYRDLAERFSVSENTIKSEVRRLRKRFRQLIEAEIAETTESPAEQREEIQYLLSLFS